MIRAASARSRRTFPHAEPGELGAFDQRFLAVIADDGDIDGRDQQTRLRSEGGIDRLDSGSGLARYRGQRGAGPAPLGEQAGRRTQNRLAGLGRLPGPQRGVVGGLSLATTPRGHVEEV